MQKNFQPTLRDFALCCGWPLSTYLKEDAEQKEVLEDDEEKEREIDGELEERVTQRAHETWR